MKTKDIEFNADDLVGSVEAFAQHLMGNQKLMIREQATELDRRPHNHAGCNADVVPRIEIKATTETK